jgi:acetylornithine deacetylase/succinyl-diaminopimelate desuccinylase-like protein
MPSGAPPSPVDLLQRLLRFDTTNPPGNERECLEWARGLLEEAGLEVKLISREPERPNLLARLAGRGTAPPLLLQGHVDVVPAGDDWRRDPFGGEAAEGYVWGRGALDMKGGVAMMLAAVLEAATADEPPPADVLLCLLSDEEAGGGLGARFLVDEHPGLFEGVRYAIGEFGGFTTTFAGRTFYPIMVAEKQVCRVRARLRGPAGHGSLPVRDGAMGKLGRLLSQLDRRRLPVHVTPVTRSMIEAIAGELPPPLAFPLRGLLRPRLTDILLDGLGERGRMFDPLLHNTAAPCIVQGGDSPNVIPGEVSVDLDGRLLPGFGPEDLCRELRELAGEVVELEVLGHDPSTREPDLALFGTLADILRELDPGARPVPMLLPAVTDGRHFARLGIQTYGYLPMQLPDDLRFMDLIHGPDERIPADAIEFGARAIVRLLERYDGRVASTW